MHTPSSITTPGPIVTLGPDIASWGMWVTVAPTHLSHSWDQFWLLDLQWHFQQDKVPLRARGWIFDPRMWDRDTFLKEKKVTKKVPIVEFTSEEVSWLTNIHPEALEFHAIQVTLFCLSWEYLLLYTGWSDLYPGQICRSRLESTLPSTCWGWRGWICKGQHWSCWRQTLEVSPQNLQSCQCSGHRQPPHICLAPQPWSQLWCLPCHGLCGRQPCPWRGNHRWHHCWGQRRGHHPSPEYLEPTPKDQQSLKKKEIQKYINKNQSCPT